MRPVKFYGHNVVIAEDQPEYLPLPAYVDNSDVTTFCWQLTFLERCKLLVTGKLWHSVKTFNDPLQPQLPSVDKPEFLIAHQERLRTLEKIDELQD